MVISSIIIWIALSLGQIYKRKQLLNNINTNKNNNGNNKNKFTCKENPKVFVDENDNNYYSKQRKDFPFTLNQYIGHSKTVKELRVLIENSNNFGISMPHMLFFGYGGLGKTTLSQIIADELGCPFIEVIGEQQTKPQDADKIIYKLKDYERSLLFIDEIHRMRNFETYYPVMEGNRFIDSKGNSFDLNNLFIVGATTDPQKLPNPFLQRFNYRFYLQPYTNEEIVEILKHCVRDKFIRNISISAIKKIAKASQGVVRMGRRELLRACKDLAIHNRSSIITEEITDKALKLKGIDPKTGLNKLQLDLLKVLKKSDRPIGSKSLSEILRIDHSFLCEYVEPYLIRENYISREKTGRVITDKGIKL